MKHALAPLVQFTAGEWAPALDSRVDLEGYRNAMRKGRNIVVLKQGGVTRRPGTQWVGVGKVSNSGNASVSSLRKFQFAPGTAFMLEFCDLGVRFWQGGANPVQLVVTFAGVPAWVTGTNYTAGSFASDAPHGVFYLFSGTNGPGTALINSTTAPHSDATHWVSQTAYEVPLPYSGTNFTSPNFAAADVCVLNIKQINDVVYIVHPNFPPWKLTRYGNLNWVSQQVGFNTPAMMDQNATDETIAASATSGSMTLTAAANGNWAGSTLYVPGNTVLESSIIYSCIVPHTSGTFLTDLANGYWQVVTNFAAGQIGGYFQLAYNRPVSYVQALATGSSAAYTLPTVALTKANGYQLPLVGTWEIQTYGTWQAVVTLGVSYDNGTTWQVITSLTSMGDANFSISGQELQGGIYSFAIASTSALASTTPPRIVITADNQFVYGLVQITAVASAYSATATVIGAPLYGTGATQYWSEGAWSAYRGYPQAVTLFQERMWYGYSSALPQRVWATQTDDIENFALIDQSQATYGLAFDLNAPGRGPIRWLAAQTDLFVGLASAEWIISSGGTTTAITPTQIQALEHTVNGSAPNIAGLIIGQACMYVQRRARAFQQMLFSVFTNKYMSTEMQVSSQHLTNAGIVQFDYQQQFQNQSILWAVCGDGSLISMAYAMEQKVFGWTKHTTGDDYPDSFISAQVMYGPDGQDDECWVAVQRGVVGNNSSSQIERIDPIDWQTANLGNPQLNEAVYADCSTTFTSTAASPNEFGPLPAVLQGRPLVASIVPASGAGMFAIRNVTPVGVNFVFIPNYVFTAGDVIVIGLAVNWVVQPMRLDLDPRLGPTPGLYKSIRKISLRTLNSIGGQWSTYGAPPVIGTLSTVTDIQQYPITQNSGNPPAFTPNIPLDVPIDVGGLFGYGLDPAFAIQGYDPLPFTLLGIAIFNDLGGET